ncbi:acyl-CoA dehydrogenase [Streptomyces noursei]|uniref:acyl-CoA dehydrogenase n=1 Tax=Streptomyces noursei TaxID=1971 RepID=UPI0023B78F89|nr:acyl-CoA dehydrogenase [Streptomyces noursei]
MSTPPQSATTRALTEALFPEGQQVHRPWRELITRPHMHPRPDLTPDEQTELAYQRLREINSTLADPVAFATNPTQISAAHEWLALVDPSLVSVLSIHYSLHLGSLVQAWHHSGRQLDDVLAMRRIGTALITELACGSDAAQITTTATRCPKTGTFLLTTPHPGAVKYMPNASPLGGPKDAVVAARLMVDGHDHGPMMFHVPLTTDAGPLPGIHIRRLPHHRTGAALDHCTIAFADVRLPAHALLEGPHGSLDSGGIFHTEHLNHRRQFLAAIDRVTPGKLYMSAAACSIARAALAIGIHYTRHRQISTPGPTTVPLAAHRTVHTPLIEGLADAVAMTLLHRRTLDTWAAIEVDGYARPTSLERTTALTKAHTTNRARDIVTTIRELCGARALFPDNPLTTWGAHLEGVTIAEGPNRGIKAKAAAELLLAVEPAPPGPWENRTVLTLDRAVTSLHDLRALLTTAHDLAVNQARSDAFLGSDRLAQANAAAAAAETAADAHTAGAAADTLHDAIAYCDHPGARFILEELARLYILREVRQHAAQLQAHGMLAASAVRQLPAAIDAVIAGLVPHMLTIATAFDLPDPYLASVPLAFLDHDTEHTDHPSDGDAPEHLAA